MLPLVHHMYKYYHRVNEIVNEYNAIFKAWFIIHSFIPYFDVFIGENGNCGITVSPFLCSLLLFVYEMRIYLSKTCFYFG